MINRIEKSKSHFGWWFGTGVIMGIALGMMLNSMITGIPMGLSLSFLTARILDRIQYDITKMIR